MSILINCHNLSKRYQSKAIFEGLNFSLSTGEKIGLVGRNGAGKSTLLKLLAGLVEQDEGSISRRTFLRVCYVPQDLEWDLSSTALDAMLAYIGEYTNLGDEQAQVAATVALSQAGFKDFDVRIDSLSGGWKKRLSLARCLVNEPDLVLFDEPTNHLDWKGLSWLLGLLKQAKFAWMMVSHDRDILNKSCQHIADINPLYPDGLKVYQSNYDSFLSARDSYIEVLMQQEASLSNKVRREVEWLKSGVKARTTKSKARIDQAKSMINELSGLRQRMGSQKADISFESSARKSKQLIVVKSVSKSFATKAILKDFSFVLTSKLKLGILGQNGSGKTTLLKLLMGSLSCDSGEIERAEQLKIVYFSQERASLDLEATVKDNLSDTGTDSINAHGRSIHIVSWAKRFLLSAEHLDLPLRSLSGGERARVAIAKLMVQPADVLILDEPTNDLDLETVEVLEDAVGEFPGCLVMVSHDRRLLENVCNAYVGLLGNANAELFADVDQWQVALQDEQRPKSSRAGVSSGGGKAQVGARKKKERLSYKEQWELDRIEAQIEDAEQKLSSCEQTLVDPEVMSDPEQLKSASFAFESAQKDVEKLYARWEELEAKKKAIES